MSLSRHREALSAFEQNDPLAGLHSKITAFKKKQTITSRANDGCYDWITLQRKLKDDETKVTGQLIKASSNLLQLFHEEKEFKCSNTWSEKGNVDPDVNRFDAIKLIQDIISSLQVSKCSSDDMISRISQVRSFNGTKKEQHALLLDLRQRLDESLEELDSLYSTLSDETAEHRRGVLLLIRDDQSTASVQHTLPQSLLDGLDSLRGLLQESHCAEDGGEVIDLLEKNLMKSLSDATSKHDSNLEQIALSNKDEPQGWDEKSQLIFKKALSSSGNGTSASNKLLLKRLRRDLLGKEEKEIVEYLNYERQKKINKIKVDAVTQDFNGKCQLIESNGLKEIQRLRNQFTSTSERKRVQDDNELKRKEMSLRVKAMRMEKEAKKVENEIQAQAMARKTGEDDRELQRTQRLLEAKRTLRKHQTQQMEDSMETRTKEFQNDFISELKGLQQQQMNRERSKYRQEKHIGKEVAKQEACQQAARLEEKRLAKLSNLAASVPYYQSIMDTTSDIHKTTKSRENDVYGGRSKLADFQSGNLKSFTNDKLFSDKNWRLGNALHEAGVANSTYARDIVRAQIPRVEARTTGIKPY